MISFLRSIFCDERKMPPWYTLRQETEGSGLWERKWILERQYYLRSIHLPDPVVVAKIRWDSVGGKFESYGFRPRKMLSDLAIDIAEWDMEQEMSLLLAGAKSPTGGTPW